MRTIIISLVLLVFLSSCRKKPIYPTDELPITTQNQSPTVTNWGEFVITDAVMYISYENGTDSVFNHFSSTKSRSSLRLGGSQFKIEDIIKDTTTYSFWTPVSFPGTGLFVLNEDTSQHYLVQYTGQYRSIIEDPTHGQFLLGGSARPFSGQTISYTNQTIAIEIEEVEGSVNGLNCRYWTQLTLKKIKSW